MRRAMVYSLFWCLVAGLCAFAAGRLLQNDDLKDGLIHTLMFPLFLITRAVSGMVDVLGPAGGAEPASHYLSQGWVVTLATLSFVLYWLVVALTIFLTRSLWKRAAKKRELAVG